MAVPHQPLPAPSVALAAEIDVSEARELYNAVWIRENETIAATRKLQEHKEKMLKEEYELIKLKNTNDLKNAQAERDLLVAQRLEAADRLKDEYSFSAKGKNLQPEFEGKTWATAIERQFDLQRYMVEQQAKSAKINANAAKLERETTLDKMKMDAEHLLDMATLMSEHPKALADIFDQHVKNLAKLELGSDAGFGIKAPGTADAAIKTIRGRAATNLAKIGKKGVGETAGTGLYRQSEQIAEKQIDIANQLRNAKIRQFNNEEALQTKQAKANLERLKNAVKIAENNIKAIRQEAFLNTEKNEASKKQIIDETFLKIQEAEKTKQSALLAVENAEKALQAQKDLNEFINNILFQVIADFAEKLKERVGGAFRDLTTALNEGTLTMQNFKEGFKAFLFGILQDMQSAILEKAIIGPITEGLGSFLGKMVGIGGEDKSISLLQQLNHTTGSGLSNLGNISETGMKSLIDTYGMPQNVIIVGQFGPPLQVMDVMGGGFGGSSSSFGSMFSGQLGNFLDPGVGSAGFGTFDHTGFSGMVGGAPTFAFARGGLVRKMAGGGSLRDRVPTLLEPGEFVIRKPMAKAIGGPALNAMNAHGATGKQNVIVNMNNQGTAQETTEQPSVSVTPTAMIVDIVTRDLQTNGPIRRSIRGNLT